jgi:shikimate kinase
MGVRTVRGVGRASGAISFVNALFTGTGCSAAIELGCEALVRLDRAAPGELSEVTVARGSDSPLVRATVESGLRAFLPNERFHVEVEIHSALPWGRGLKSSSAVTGAVLEAIASARGQVPDPLELARRSADVSQAIGLSATGAFDDAVAALLGGVALTENASRTVRLLDEMDAGLRVALWTPDEVHPPSPKLLARFRALRAGASDAVRAAEERDFLDAMEINTRLVEKALGLDYSFLRRLLAKRGAVAAGISGVGPTLAAIAPEARADEVLASLPQHRGRCQLVRFRPPGHPSAGVFDTGPRPP